MAFPQPGTLCIEMTTDATQLDILIGLRIMEELGKALLSPHDIHFEPDCRLIQILNWLMLCLARDASPAYHDVAATVSTEAGRIVIYLTKGSACPPTQDELYMTSIILGTLRRVLYEGLRNPEREFKEIEIYECFLWMLAEHTFPAFNRKLTLIGTADADDPQQTFNRFCELVKAWLRVSPEGERYIGLINLAHERDESPTDVFIEAVRDIMQCDSTSEPVTIEEKYLHMNTVLEKCTLTVNSSFFADVINQNSPLIKSLESFDVVFLNAIFKRVLSVANYSFGCAEFSQHGIKTIKKILGTEYLWEFVYGTGGILVNWIHNDPSPYKTFHWPASPSDEISRILGLDKFDFGHLDSEQYMSIAHSEAILNLWTKDEPVSPILHAELQMISYLEEHGIDIVGGAIGMNQQPCWACDKYMEELLDLRDSIPGRRHRPKYRMTHTTGRPRGYWLIPPGSNPNIVRALFSALDDQVGYAVEDYVFQYYP